MDAQTFRKTHLGGHFATAPYVYGEVVLIPKDDLFPARQRVYFDCPYCGDEHSHPWEPGQEKTLQHRVAHCLKCTPEEKARGYWIEIASTDWPEPKPILAELKPVPAFDAEVLLPDVLRAWVMDEAERMPCPPDFIAGAALVALGSIIGAHCAIKPKSRDSWLIVPNLWGGIVGDPSAKKSPAWGVALRPMDKLIADANKANKAALAEYETEKLVHEARKDDIEGRVKAAAKKSSKGDPAIIAKEFRNLSEQAPEQPKPRRYKSNDTTVEKLGELLRDNPAGVMVLRDELVGLIANWEREGREGDRAFFLEAWNGNQSFDTDRIGRGHIEIANLCVSIFGGIQPDKLIAYLEEAANALGNDGMLQRFQLLVFPDPRRWEWRDRSPDKAAREAAQAIFDKLAEFDPVAFGAAPADDIAKFPFFWFDEGAQAVFIEWAHDLNTVRMPSEEQPIIRQHLAKYEKLFPALALIFHLVDCAAHGVCGPVSKEAALRAAAWCEYLEAHARRCYGLLKDDGLRAAQALAAKLERGKLEDGFSLRDVRRNQWRSLTTEESIQAALDWLEDEGWLRSKAAGVSERGGRPTTIYTIHPALKAKTAAV
ncbi:MAG: YfjI family protein [Pseudomonadota bacterium]